MEAHQTGALAYEPHKFLCTKIDNRGVKMMSGQGKIDHCIYVTDRLGVCGLQFETTSPNAFFVSTEGLKPGIPGVQVPIVGGDRDMPTSAWISQFSSPKKQKVIFDAYNEGKTIYFRSRMPFIFGWCALIKFAKAQHINSDGLLALYQKYKPAASGDIAPLLAEPIFRKCYNTPLFTQLVRDADAS
nr:putative polyprotein [Bombus-associated virus Nep2]